MNSNVDEVVKNLAPDPGPGLTPVAQEMMNKIMDAEPAPTALPTPRRKWRPLVALPIAAAVIAAGWAVPSILSAAPASALDIKEEGGYYVIEVKDLYTNPEVYESQLRGVGLDISLRLVPASPSLVGLISPDSPVPDSSISPNKIETIDQPGQCDRRSGCPIGLKIPKDFTGSAEVTLGREGRPGEEYQIITGIDTPGEPLHCVPFYNKPAGEVRALLKDRGLDIQEFSIVGPEWWGGTAGDEEPETNASVPDSMHVIGGFLPMTGKATLQVSDEELPAETVRTMNEKYGCQGG
ncbi:hypothetical protein SAMN05216275_1475 [Streptosporangium canum]|uniref:Uncharacterized protein n=1 Tax=Streptosporangium canum TaxID=324952 RepID=A0A1I4E4Z6_9ACTN|nr:hypothetical protein [Streptosporangium canum]SFL00904.1 hypothetical protein SAMN05216275_1475 [Streptosporangium canum]